MEVEAEAAEAEEEGRGAAHRPLTKEASELYHATNSSKPMEPSLSVSACGGGTRVIDVRWGRGGAQLEGAAGGAAARDPRS